MEQRRKYKLEQPRNSSNNPLYGNHLTTSPKSHYIYNNTYEQLKANSTFRDIHINLKAAREKGQSYEIPQQQPFINRNINQPRINENHYFAESNEDFTNEMERKEKNRRLENKRQHRLSKYRRSHRSSQTSSDDVGYRSSPTDFSPNTSNANKDGSSKRGGRFRYFLKKYCLPEVGEACVEEAFSQLCQIS
ncbi:unnamed protein product [Adineta steineri]|uniref:Uncharacterized protein n=1 Tax=Adineta steineri TaxID=433720 RepID=A0A813QF81_9BILA|nr:unnamed protein product [Adineta steineri]CAF3972574.1 unnamed protein product [Adineta steineri]